MECEGWAPGSCTDPNGAPGDLKQPRFPYDEHLVATVRPLDDYSNTYIGLYVEDPALGRESSSVVIFTSLGNLVTLFTWLKACKLLKWNE